MKGMNGKFVALCACALLFYGCEKDDQELDSLNVQESGSYNDCDVINFEGYSGRITQVNSAGGFGPILVNNRARNSSGDYEGGNQAMIFNSNSPTGDDDDLAADWGKVLIIQNLLVPSVPDDNTYGGKMLLTFPEPVTVISLRALDIDENENASFVYLLDENKNVLASEQLEPEGDNSKQTITFNGSAGVEGVVYIKVVLNGTGDNEDIVGSGAIDNIRFCVPEEEEEHGCTYTQGYWKNHPDAWPRSINPGAEFFRSDKTYMEILKMAPKGGNAYIILAHQYIAAKLNIKNGASDADIDEVIEDVEAYFASKGNGVYTEDKNSSMRDDLLEWAEILDDYNNGVNGVGPGHCDE